MYSEKISIKYKLAEKEVLIPLSAFLFVGMLLIANFLLNLSLELIETTFSDLLHPKPFHIEIGFLFRMPIAEHPIYYLLVFLLVIGTIARTVYKLKSSFKNLNNHEKGSSRFTTVEELKKQYRAVPDREESFKGGGGVVISRLGDKVFIDDSPVNNLIIGTTRSGKGETFVFPTIDVYSRAEHKPSLIFNDPKGELFSASKETLEERGYHIEVLNLLTPLDSMSYNLLQLVKDAYKDGDYSTAQALCKTLSHTLYYKPGVKDPFWQDCAMSLCNAMILAITDKCIAEGTEEKITMYAVANMLSELGSKEIIIDPEEPLKNALDLYFENLPSDSVAKMQYATSNFSKGQARGGIFTQTMNGLSIFTFDEIAKMTAKNSVDLKRVGFGKTIKGKVTPRKRIEIVFPDGSKESIKSDITGRFALDFKKVIKVGDTIQFNEKGNKKKKTSISIMKIDEKTGDTEFKVVEENEDIQVITVDYFDKPVAIFMITPDFDSSNHVIASIFVRQLYFILAKGASLARGGKCHREVVFCLDEFGNMPSIEGMANIITVCLGRNVRFNLVIQAYAQLKNKYGEDADTIDGNCGNTIYILTNDQETAEKVSKKLGNQTINLSSRSGKGLSTDKNKTESLDQRPLLTANELMNFKEGESAVIRVIKRQDNNRKRIRPRPIYNTGETALKYRWEYLGVEFDTDKSILDIDIDSLHDDVNPKSLIVDFLGERKAEQIEKKTSEPEQVQEETSSKIDTPQIVEEPTMMGIDEDIPEEAFQQEDSPFDSLSIKNWKEKTVNEFFESDLAVLKLVDKFFLAQLGKSLDEVENQEMGEFYSEFQMLAHNDHIDKSVYQAVENKINRILRDLEEKEQVTS